MKKIILFSFVVALFYNAAWSQAVNPFTQNATDQDSLQFVIYTNIPTTNCTNSILVFDTLFPNIIQLDLHYNLFPYSTQGNCGRTDIIKYKALPSGSYLLKVYETYFDTIPGTLTPFYSYRNTFYTDSFIVSSTTNIKELEFKYVSISPNPASDFVKIQNPNQTPINQIQIWDLSGRLVKEMMYESEEIDVSDLASGVYVLRVLTERGIKEMKLVKQ